jgi:hypothetical protein
MTENRPTIPTDLKRQVLIESGHRCAIPQCRHSANVDVHHIIPWSECKKHDFDNLIALCPNCHRQVHDGKIDRKSLLKYKSNLRNFGQVNTISASENLMLDRKTFERLKKVIPPSLFQRFKLSAFGDHKTMEILQPLYDFVNLCDDPTFVFKNQEFEDKKNQLYRVAKDAIEYIHPLLQHDDNGDIQIGPTEGPLGSDIDAMHKWSSILDNSAYKIFDFFDVYNPFIAELMKELT